MMKTKMVVMLGISVMVLIFAIAWGSVQIPINDVFAIIIYRIFGEELPNHISGTTVAILWELRLPRVLLAFIAGGALAVSGTVMQSTMRNPLASSYTLGVSSGASLGASIILFYGAAIPIIANVSLPLMGFIFGLGTILLAMAIAQRIDGGMQNNTIILVGMVFSLFINAITTLMSALTHDQVQRLLFWQMGSFSMKGWQAVWILAPLVVLVTLWITYYHHELDIMTFGENQAQTMGINLKRVKWTLLILAAALTGGTIAFSGVIGFVDLIAPHIVRKIFGSKHRYVILMSAIFGGIFMVISDLVARTIISPSELPVGVVTAIIGAPFFIYIYFGGRKKRRWIPKC